MAAQESDPLLANAEEGDLQKLKAEADEAGLTESQRFAPLADRIKDVVRVYWHLGWIAFGGPSAHVAILRDHLVVVNDWLSEEVFLELFAVGQGLPGPSSTQLVISTAATHGGALGGIIAFAMWCLPGFLVLAVSGRYLYNYIDPTNPPIWLLGVPPAAMSLIFKAAYGFVKKLDTFGIAIGMVACMVSVMINGDLRIPSMSSQIVYPALLVGGALATFIDYMQENSIGTYVKPAPATTEGGPKAAEPSVEDRKLAKKIGITIWQGILFFFLWLGLLVGTIVAVNVDGLVSNSDGDLLNLFESYFRIGSLIFGGGIVMIPMAQSEFVANKGWLNDDQFFQGVGLAQSLPGPLFNFSAFLGATYAGWPGAIIAAVGLFGPGLILIFAMLPIWSRTRHLAWFKAVLKGLNASAIGLIAGGCVFLYAKSVRTAADAMVFILAGGLAALYSVQAPAVIFTGAVAGALFSSSVLNVGQKEY